MCVLPHWVSCMIIFLGVYASVKASTDNGLCCMCVCVRVSTVHGLSVSEYLLIDGQIFNQHVLELRGGFNEY